MSNSSNKAVVPEAKSALDKFKFEVANEIGVPLKDGYNGELTSRQNGSVGGYMVKKTFTEQPPNINSQHRILLAEQESIFSRNTRSHKGYKLLINYTYSLSF